MVLVGQAEPQLDDLGPLLQRPLAHPVQGLLQGEAVRVHERADQCAAYPGVGVVPVGTVGPAVPPLRGDRCGKDPVPGLRQRRVRILDVSPELRIGGVQQHQPGHPGHHRCMLAVVGDHSGADLATGTGERMRSEPGPAVLLDGDAGGGDGGLGRHEMSGQEQTELLDLADAVLLGERVHRVLLGVGGQHRSVVAGQVRTRPASRATPRSR